MLPISQPDSLQFFSLPYLYHNYQGFPTSCGICLEYESFLAIHLWNNYSINIIIDTVPKPSRRYLYYHYM